MILYSIRSETKPVKRCQNTSDVLEFLERVQQFEQEHSGCVGDDLFDISEDHSTDSYSSQAWSVRWGLHLLFACRSLPPPYIAITISMISRGGVKINVSCYMTKLDF